MDFTSAPIPSIILPPLFTITDTDKSGIVAVFVAFSLAVVLSSLVLRGQARYRSWKTDDWLICAASCLSTARTAVIFYQIHLGLGKTDEAFDDDNLQMLERMIWGGDILFLVANVASKLSVIFLIQRLTSLRKQRVLISLIMGAVALWGAVSILLISVRCFPSVLVDTHCSGLLARWLVIGVWDIVLEILLFCTSVFLLCRQVLKWRTSLLIVMIFALRLPMIAAAIARMVYINADLRSPDPTLAQAWVTMCTQIELDYGIIASTLTCLGPLVSPFTKDLVYMSSTTDNDSSGEKAKHSGVELSVLSIPRNATIDELPDLMEERLRQMSGIDDRMAYQRLD